MSRGPWYISARAVLDYLEIRGRRVVDDGPGFDEASDELIALAIDTVGREPRLLANGSLQYRTGRPLRLRMIVVPSERAEGTLPQLVRVMPSHD